MKLKRCLLLFIMFLFAAYRTTVSQVNSDILIVKEISELASDFNKFVLDPTAEEFMRIRDRVVLNVSYFPYDIIDTITPGPYCGIYLEECDEISKRTEICELNVLLSPRAHLISAYCYYENGDSLSAEFEILKYEACIFGILSSGEGTFESPYFVTRIPDEYDLLRYLDKEMIRQNLIDQNNRYYDCLHLTDSTSIYFDITDMINKLKQQLSDIDIE